jgi:hypothetical protein
MMIDNLSCTLKGVYAKNSDLGLGCLRYTECSKPQCLKKYKMTYVIGKTAGFFVSNLPTNTGSWNQMRKEQAQKIDK